MHGDEHAMSLVAPCAAQHALIDWHTGESIADDPIDPETLVKALNDSLERDPASRLALLGNVPGRGGEAGGFSDWPRRSSASCPRTRPSRF